MKILLVIGLIVLVILFYRMTTEEDFWLCSDRRWIKHGNPSLPSPAKGCSAPQSILGNKSLDEAVETFLLSKEEFSWKTTPNTTNICVFQNLDPEEDGLSPVFIWTRCGEFGIENGEIKEFSGASQPAKIFFPNEASNYDVGKFTYQIPRSGSLYDKDVKTIFPERIWDNLNFDGRQINEHIWAKASSALFGR